MTVFNRRERSVRVKRSKKPIRLVSRYLVTLWEDIKGSVGSASFVDPSLQTATSFSKMRLLMTEKGGQQFVCKKVGTISYVHEVVIHHCSRELVLREHHVRDDGNPRVERSPSKVFAANWLACFCNPGLKLERFAFFSREHAQLACMFADLPTGVLRSENFALSCSHMSQSNPARYCTSLTTQALGHPYYRAAATSQLQTFGALLGVFIRERKYKWGQSCECPQIDRTWHTEFTACLSAFALCLPPLLM